LLDVTPPITTVASGLCTSVPTPVLSTMGKMLICGGRAFTARGTPRRIYSASNAIL
jgi:hypothetical protein